MSTAVFALAKKEDKYEDVDFETLLEQLSPEEIEELSLELIDPDDSHIPPADRCRYKMDKAPTGPFDRKKLLEFLEKKAREEKDWEDAKPYVKEIRGTDHCIINVLIYTLSISIGF
ncbi:hypothetical protein NP493_92g07012 [Ridgeia piscesae]|uniref:Tropomodulin n=1 Tax=Ridgeia piscesae TaxID=27915 RepID=A0AAD9UHX4_RIDPI|nr:hypothetical protein NP493_92g07012 [Ridgeia piscesae]